MFCTVDRNRYTFCLRPDVSLFWHRNMAFTWYISWPRGKCASNFHLLWFWNFKVSLYLKNLIKNIKRHFFGNLLTQVSIFVPSIIKENSTVENSRPKHKTEFYMNREQFCFPLFWFWVQISWLCGVSTFYSCQQTSSSLSSKDMCDFKLTITINLHGCLLLNKNVRSGQYERIF